MYLCRLYSSSWYHSLLRTCFTAMATTTVLDESAARLHEIWAPSTSCSAVQYLLLQVPSTLVHGAREASDATGSSSSSELKPYSI